MPECCLEIFRSLAWAGGWVRSVCLMGVSSSMAASQHEMDACGARGACVLARGCPQPSLGGVIGVERLVRRYWLVVVCSSAWAGGWERRVCSMGVGLRFTAAQPGGVAGCGAFGAGVSAGGALQHRIGWVAKAVAFGVGVSARGDLQPSLGGMDGCGAFCAGVLSRGRACGGGWVPSAWCGCVGSRNTAA